jgi:hypothetical protein
MTALIVLGLAIYGAVAAWGNWTDHWHRRATVVKMAWVNAVPTNLSQRPECQEAWGTIARLGIAMDAAADDWNQQLLSAAYQLVQDGCTGGDGPTMGGLPDPECRYVAPARAYLTALVTPLADGRRPIDALAKNPAWSMVGDWIPWLGPQSPFLPGSVPSRARAGDEGARAMVQLTARRHTVWWALNGPASAFSDDELDHLVPGLGTTTVGAETLVIVVRQLLDSTAASQCGEAPTADAPPPPPATPEPSPKQLEEFQRQVQRELDASPYWRKQREKYDQRHRWLAEQWQRYPKTADSVAFVQWCWAGSNQRPIEFGERFPSLEVCLEFQAMEEADGSRMNCWCEVERQA